MPDRTHSLLFIADMPAFGAASFEPILLYLEITRVKQTKLYEPF